jgi:hypothetical protein
MPHFWSLLGAASAPACRLAALLALLVGAAGCGADAGPDAGTDPPPDPAPDGCVSYGQYATGAVPCGTVVAWVGGLVTDLDVQDGIAVLASLTSGLRVVDVSDPRLPRLVGTAASPGALAVDLQDGLVAIAEGVHGFSLYDISDPTAPLHLVRQSVTTAVASPGATDAVALAGDRLFVAGFHRNLVCYDVSDPRRPVERGRLVMDRPGDLAVVGDRLVAGGRAVVSIATDGNLAMVAELPHGAAEDLCVADATVYAAVAEGLPAPAASPWRMTVSSSARWTPPPVFTSSPRRYPRLR